MRHGHTSFWCALILAVCGLSLLPGEVHARGRRGPSAAQVRAAMQKYQQYMQQQQNLANAQVKKDKETIARFDTNGNGKIDSNEKAPWDKFWREVREGKQPHPYAAITANDIKPKTTTTKKK